MEFRLSEYRRFIGSLMESGYRTVSFADGNARSLVDPNLFLRHDIDMDPAAALRMATVEAEVGARSTYFVLLSNRHTNPFDAEFRRSVVELQRLGHWIGLHFDATQYNLTAKSASFNERVMYEAGMLASACNVPIESVSFHRPARDLLGAPGDLTSPLPHTYESFFIREIEYCSDSSGRWAYGPPNERSAIKELRPFQFLTHPISWGDSDRAPTERISDWIVQRAQTDHQYELPDEPDPFEGLR